MTADELQDYRVERLQLLVEKKFGRQKVRLGRALGHKSGAFVRQLLERERPITEKTVQAIHELPGCAEWFTPAPNEQPKLRLVTTPESVDHPLSHQTSNLQPMIQVPLLAVRASMGSGSDANGEEMVRSLSLSPQWISTALRPSRAEALKFIHGAGDSMSPTFNSGDVLLIDTDVIDVNIPGVYVLEAQDQTFIKRVNRRLDGQFEISSDNPAHRTVEVLRGDHEVKIKGRVIWVWNGRKI